MANVCVAEPNFWWRAPANRVRQLVSTDLGVIDGRRRWDNRDLLDWSLIARAVTEVSESVAAGTWTPDPEGGSGCHVPINTDNLSAGELGIVRSWFSESEAVRVDPWIGRVMNGRHRLWSTLDKFGTALVPIAGSELQHANELETVGAVKTWVNIFNESLKEFNTLDWFDYEDPMNRRFVTAMDQAAKGQHPTPA